MNKDQIIISCTNFPMHPRILSISRAKCQKLLDHSPDIIHLNVELTRCSKNKAHKATGHLHLKGKPIVLHATSDNLLKSVDQLIHKLDRSLRRRSRIAKFKRYLGLK